MSVAVRLSGVVVAFALVGGGCGGSRPDEPQSSQAQQVVKELQSMRKGEIVIKGTSARAYGPYALKPGGYVFRFDQSGSGGRTRLVVALESKPGSKAAPYQRVVDSEERSGTRRVTLSGKVYVHVVTAEAGYELRLAPRAD